MDGQRWVNVADHRACDLERDRWVRFEDDNSPRTDARDLSEGGIDVALGGQVVEALLEHDRVESSIWELQRPRCDDAEVSVRKPHAPLRNVEFQQIDPDRLEPSSLQTIDE